MKISTKGRYGIRLMICLALNYKEGHISLKEIAKKQELSEKYLEQIINPLTKAGLVNSYRGAQGGYCLTKEPSKITVGEILHVLEGSLSPVDCVDNETNCPKSSCCSSISLWRKIKEAVDDVVNNVTLADLVEEETQATNNLDFYI